MGTAGQWANRAAALGPGVAVAAWAAVAVGGWVLGLRRGYALGNLLFAEAVWVLVFAAFARDALRNLFGPVFVYELVRVGRRRITYIVRGLYVLGLCGMLGILYLQWLDSVRYFNRYSESVAPGEIAKFATEFFYIFVAVQFAVVALLTPAYVAGTIADEKERRTLEFLLATDLRNREIVFGKLAARAANLVMLVLAGLPLLAMLQLFGGIDPELVLAAAAATTVSMFGLAAVSIYASATIRKPRDAIMLTYLLAGVYVIVSATLAAYVTNGLVRNNLNIVLLLGYQVDLEVLTDAFAAGNLPYLLLSSAAARRSGTFGPDEVADILTRLAAFWGVVGPALVLLAIARLRRVALKEPAVAGTGRRARAAARNRPAIGDDPMFWKEVFVDGGFRGGWVVPAVIIGLTFIAPVILVFTHFGDLILTAAADVVPRLREWVKPIWFVSQYTGGSFATRWFDFAEAINHWVRIASGLLAFLLMIAAAVRGASTVSGERDRDTWLSLISTPLTGREMIVGKWWGAVLGMRRGFGLLVAVWATGLLCGSVNFLLVLLAAAVTAVYVGIFAWIGVYCSVTARTTLVATIRAFLAAAFAAGGFWPFLALCCGAPMSMMRASDNRELFDNLAILMIGGTPPFVVGWLPMGGPDGYDLSPFAWRDASWFGPFAPFLGLVWWSFVGFVCAMRSWDAIDVLANRTKRRRRPTPPPDFPD